jgi:hypothetical protein
VRRAFLLLAVTNAALTAVAASGAPVAVGSHAGSARLLLMDSPAFALRGVGFKADERVRITVDTSTRDVTRTTTASSAGGFTVRMAGVNPSACQGFAATAVGSDGSRAVFKRAPGQCPSLTG